MAAERGVQEGSKAVLVWVEGRYQHWVHWCLLIVGGPQGGQWAGRWPS